MSFAGLASLRKMLKRRIANADTNSVNKIPDAECMVDVDVEFVTGLGLMGKSLSAKWREPGSNRGAAPMSHAEMDTRTFTVTAQMKDGSRKVIGTFVEERPIDAIAAAKCRFTDKELEQVESWEAEEEFI